MMIKARVFETKPIEEIFLSFHEAYKVFLNLRGAKVNTSSFIYLADNEEKLIISKYKAHFHKGKKARPRRIFELTEAGEAHLTLLISLAVLKELELSKPIEYTDNLITGLELG